MRSGQLVSIPNGFRERRRQRFFSTAVVMAVLTVIVLALFLGIALGGCGEPNSQVYRGWDVFCGVASGPYAATVEPLWDTDDGCEAYAAAANETPCQVESSVENGLCHVHTGFDCFAAHADSRTVVYDRVVGGSLRGVLTVELGSCARSYAVTLTRVPS